VCALCRYFASSDATIIDKIISIIHQLARSRAEEHYPCMRNVYWCLEKRRDVALTTRILESALANGIIADAKALIPLLAKSKGPAIEALLHSLVVSSDKEIARTEGNQ
jgi:inactivated superfamily I helicase